MSNSCLNLSAVLSTVFSLRGYVHVRLKGGAHTALHGLFLSQGNCEAGVKALRRGLPVPLTYVLDIDHRSLGYFVNGFSNKRLVAFCSKHAHDFVVPRMLSVLVVCKRQSVCTVCRRCRKYGLYCLLSCARTPLKATNGMSMKRSIMPHLFLSRFVAALLLVHPHKLT